MRPIARLACHAVPGLLLLLSATAAADESPAELLRLPEPSGLARLVRPEAPAAPVVIMLPDALGDDGRAEPYVDSLLARGIATLALGLGEDTERPDGAVEPAAAPGAVAPARAWAEGAAQGRVGVLGFGLGGRAALAGAAGLPVAALYPGCARLPQPKGPAFVLQGAEAAEDCDALSGGAITLLLLPGAGHGWDAPGAIWPSPGPLLPDPAGGPRLRARMDLDATLTAAEAVADWFEHWLFGGARSAAR